MAEGVVLKNGIELDLEQVEMLIQALGDLLMASGISALPMSGPELLAHAESLRLWLEEQRAGRMNQDIAAGLTKAWQPTLSVVPDP